MPRILTIIKQSIKRRGITGALRSLLITLMKPVLWYTLTPLRYTQVMLFIVLGYWPNLHKPKRLNEKIANYRLLNYPELALIVCDKLRMREYVAQKIGHKILNKLYYATDNPETIPFDDLPSKYIVKMNNGSGRNIIVRDASSIDRAAVIDQCWKWIKRSPYKFTYNIPLEDYIKPMVLIEKLMEDNIHGVPLDYRFFVIGKQVKFIEVIKGRFSTGTYCTTYDKDWNLLEFTRGLPKGVLIPKTEKLKEMISIAEKLSEDFDFCRLDLYLLNNKDIKFGEITLSPGILPFKPRKYDDIMGSYWL